MKEKHFLNLSSEIPKLLQRMKQNQLKGGFKKSSNRMLSK